MSATGFHLTFLGEGRALFEPAPSLDVGRTDGLVEEIVRRLQGRGASRLYYDLSDLMVIDDVYYGWLDRLARACEAVNARLVGVGIQPTAAFALAGRLTAPPRFETVLDIVR